MKKLNRFYLLGACAMLLMLVAAQMGLAQKITIVATDQVTSDTVVLGLRADATNDIDAALGEEEQPPYSPTFTFRSTTNTRTIGKDTVFHGSGPGGLKINYHRLVTVTQKDGWKLVFASDESNGSTVTFSWTIDQMGAGGWELEDGQFPANMPGSIDMTTQSSYTYPVKTSYPEMQYVYVNYFDGLKLRTGTANEIATAPDIKNVPAGKPIKLKADKASWCFKFTHNPDDGSPLHVTFGNAIHHFESLGGFSSATNTDGGKLKKYDFSGGGPTGDVTICGWSKGGKAQKVADYIWGAGAKNKDAAVVGTQQLLNPMPNWWNAIDEVYKQGVWNGNLLAGKAAGLLVGQPSIDGKTGKAVYHPKYADIYKTLFVKKDNNFQDGMPPGCLDKFTDGSGKDILKPQKSLTPKKFDNKLLGDAVAFRVNLGIYQALKVLGAGNILPGLIYDGAGVYNGMPVSAIDADINPVLACGTGTGTPQELDDALAAINAAFSGAMDTSQWAGKMIMKGVTAIGKTSILHRNSLEAAPVVALPPFRQENETPYQFRLEQNYPNPFNPTTTIDFTLPGEGFVTLKVYNLLGQEVATLLNQEQMEDGEQTVEFDAATLSSGVYYYRLVLNDGEFTAVKKMMLLK